MVYPVSNSAPEPHPDLPADIATDFEEARLILASSPRGAAALLRLCVQKLCLHFGLDGKSLNEDIATLVDRGLPVEIQQALDIVRVVGNNAVHPGQIDLNDNPGVATNLFDLVNAIVQTMISQRKLIAELYTSIVPEVERDKIKKRDGT